MFPNLKLQIFRRGSHQNRLAKAVGIDETVLSKIIHGYRNPTLTQKKLLASYLEADEGWLFERCEAYPLRADLEQTSVAAEKKTSSDGDI
jgi:transcriptional regulator with XRE-family HTH domain